MKHTFRALVCAFTLAVVVSLGASVKAHHYVHGELFIDHPFARATIGQAGTGAAYMSIHNEGAEADRLVEIRAEVSERVEIHTHIEDQGIMRMRRVEGGLAVPAGETVALEPGGLHVMFIGLHAPLREGDMFPMTLVFERAGDVEVQVMVESIASRGGHEHHDHHDHGHDHGHGGGHRH